ncbi:MAG TPA: EAL domain-containing protein [Gammaproteobacteria bacterium]|nr:EAL domain-containing protein [Gammaproteobacteria bacterium]
MNHSANGGPLNRKDTYRPVQIPGSISLLQQACELIVRHTGSTATYIATIEDTPTPRAHLAAVAGPSGAYAQALPVATSADEPGGNGLVGRVYRERAPLVSNDCLNDPRFAHMADALSGWNVLAAAGVPLFIDAQVRAVLVVGSDETEHYTRDLVPLLERIAEVLATGMDRAEEKVRRRRYQALYTVQSEVNALIARGPEPSDLFEQTCRIIAGASSALHAYVALFEPDPGDLRIVACAREHLDPELRRALMAIRFSTRADGPAGHGVASTAFREGHTVVAQDIDVSGNHSMRPGLLSRAGTRSLMGIPILVEGKPAATLILGSPERHFFDPALVEVGEQVGASLGVALQAHAQRESLRTMALTDALTGLPNRTLYEDRLRMAMAQTDRTGGQVALALIDLDNLKEVNARLGHAVGDAVIKDVARRLTQCLRRGDTLARLGGDEFVAVLRMNHTKPTMDGVLSRMLATAAEPQEHGPERVSVSASIGVALYPRDGQQPEELLRRADLALSRVKSEGGDSWGVFEQSLEEQLWRRHRLRERFPQALAQGEIVFHYQPIVELKSGRVAGAEALARWQDPERGLLAPDEWIALVEDSPALIRALGRHALHSAMNQLQVWGQAGRNLSLSVNIGVRHLLCPEFCDDVEEAVAIAPALAPNLVLEVTERALIDDFGKVATVLSACDQLGLKIALDDFGTGQASLTYLLELPADQLKIDHSFVLGMLTDFRAFGIVASAAQGTRMLGMRAVGEGAESEEHGLRLLQLGCRYAQGFGIARPMPPEAFESWLRAWTPPESWTADAGRPLTRGFIPVLGSLILHRGRCATVLGERRRGGVDRTVSPEVWSAYCPINLEAREADRALHDYGLSDAHREIHRLERACFARLAESGDLPQSLSGKLQRALGRYETGVDEVLSRRSHITGPRRSFGAGGG